MQVSDGTFHTREEMEAIFKKKPAERFVLFKPGQRVVVDSTTMIVCREKNDRLILRGENAAETLREKRIREEFEEHETHRREALSDAMDRHQEAADRLEHKETPGGSGDDPIS